MREEVLVDVAFPPEQAFDLVADFGRLQEWDPNVVSSAWRTPGPAVGAFCEVVVRFLGQSPEVVYELLEWDPPRKAVYFGRARMMESIDTIVVDPHQSGTRILLAAEVTLRSFLRLLRPVLPLIFRRQARAGVAGLHRMLGRLG